MRPDGRASDELRSVQIQPDFIIHPEGSVLITIGRTKVICNASIEDRVPPFMRGQKKGWITAEYSMLPRATPERNIRESSKGKVTGRTMEIQRLIGRALRSVVKLEDVGERTIWIDCDVIQADGGTRTASITGAFVAMVLAFKRALEHKQISKLPIKSYLAATSVGVHPIYGPILDLCYKEDSTTNVDMNIVMNGQDEYIEIQGTGEEATFSEKELATLLSLAKKGIHQLIEAEKAVLGDLFTEQKVGTSK
ncbi:ribonuclease PH [Sporolactobacillus laevolacticus]|uniref:Ribonuclease PH n=1 Tax=Sporolactobacillus laevolacticus DSM 442 TaxID=1395513 RepID=V6J0Q5_9BACL|nr:ribonuclease PH [Sporolactobacillus laevolacticus]EST13493.1 ribonuclease PH [Sporolactobacillus laevolacticus DSM 442]MDN3955569.1 ribonuclease PH [Sporolactobacillus laevolacticus]